MTPPQYPTAAEVDAWCEALNRHAEAVEFEAAEAGQPDWGPAPVPWHAAGHCRYVAFTCAACDPFYGYWQTVPSGGPAPTLVHLPGYGGEMSAHPDLVAAGYNVLHVNPLGYCTPAGLQVARQVNGNWPVLPETALSGGERGYADWLTQALVAVRWLRTQPEVQPERLGCFGTSQGGGGALLLASLLRDRGVRAVAADLPFLTDFRWMVEQTELGAYSLVFPLPEALAAQPERLAAYWRGLGLIDTLSHAHRLTLPVLLHAETTDTVCPPATIRALFEALPGTRSYTETAGLEHAHNPQFVQLALAWFRSYV